MYNNWYKKSQHSNIDSDGQEYFEADEYGYSPEGEKIFNDFINKSQKFLLNIPHKGITAFFEDEIGDILTPFVDKNGMPVIIPDQETLVPILQDVYYGDVEDDEELLEAQIMSELKLHLMDFEYNDNIKGMSIRFDGIPLSRIIPIEGHYSSLEEAYYSEGLIEEIRNEKMLGFYLENGNFYIDGRDEEVIKDVTNLISDIEFQDPYLIELENYNSLFKYPEYVLFFIQQKRNLSSIKLSNPIRYQKFLDKLSSDPYVASNFAKSVLKKRFFQAEPNIFSDKTAISMYKRDVLAPLGYDVAKINTYEDLLEQDKEIKSKANQKSWYKLSQLDPEKNNDEYYSDEGEKIFNSFIADPEKQEFYIILPGFNPLRFIENEIGDILTPFIKNGMPVIVEDESLIANAISEEYYGDITGDEDELQALIDGYRVDFIEIDLIEYQYLSEDESFSYLPNEGAYFTNNRFINDASMDNYELKQELLKNINKYFNQEIKGAVNEEIALVLNEKTKSEVEFNLKKEYLISRADHKNFEGINQNIYGSPPISLFRNFDYGSSFEDSYESFELKILEYMMNNMGYSKNEVKNYFIYDSNSALEYAILFDSPFANGSKEEGLISSDGYNSLEYAKKVLRSSFPRGEEEIAKDPFTAFEYSILINAPFPKGEETMSHNPNIFRDYLGFLMKKKFPITDDLINEVLNYDAEFIKNFAIEYYRNYGERIIEEAEDEIFKDFKSRIDYATKVILPFYGLSRDQFDDFDYSSIVSEVESFEEIILTLQNPHTDFRKYENNNWYKKAQEFIGADGLMGPGDINQQHTRNIENQFTPPDISNPMNKPMTIQEEDQINNDVPENCPICKSKITSREIMRGFKTNEGQTVYHCNQCGYTNNPFKRTVTKIRKRRRRSDNTMLNFLKLSATPANPGISGWGNYNNSANTPWGRLDLTEDERVIPWNRINDGFDTEFDTQRQKGNIEERLYKVKGKDGKYKYLKMKNRTTGKMPSNTFTDRGRVKQQPRYNPEKSEGGHGAWPHNRNPNAAGGWYQSDSLYNNWEFGANGEQRVIPWDDYIRERNQHLLTLTKPY